MVDVALVFLPLNGAKNCQLPADKNDAAQDHRPNQGRLYAAGGRGPELLDRLALELLERFRSCTA